MKHQFKALNIRQQMTVIPERRDTKYMSFITAAQKGELKRQSLKSRKTTTARVCRKKYQKEVNTEKFQYLQRGALQYLAEY